MGQPEKNDDEPSQFSLSSAILAPITSLVQAQVHNSRAFLNYLLQLGYRHASDDDINAAKNSELTPFTLPFVNRVQINGEEVLQRIEIPALALVPTIPLGIESAEFEYQFAIDRYTSHTQLQSERVKTEQKSKQEKAAAGDQPAAEPANANRPWFLVEDPVSFQGKIGGGDGGTEDGGSRQQSSIHIKIKVGQMAVPSGLDKLLTALTQSATTHIVVPENKSPQAALPTETKE